MHSHQIFNPLYNCCVYLLHNSSKSMQLIMLPLHVAIICYFSVYEYFVNLHSLDAKSVIKKTKERPLKLEGSELKVSTIHELTHDKSILLAKNLNPVTKKETFQNFIESTKNVDVFNVILGQDGKAVVVLKNEIGKWVLQF